MTEQRIGDADREVAAADLGEHFAQGRLSAEEHAERLDQAMRAKTRAELTPLFSDLPGGAYGVHPATTSSLPPYSVATSAEDSRGRSWRPGPFVRIPGPLLVLLVIVVAVTVLTRVPIFLVGLLLWVGVFKHRGWNRRC